MLVEAQVASWDILRMPVEITSGRHDLSTEEDVLEHLDYGQPKE